MTEYIFRQEDEPLLTPVNDDGDLVQPELLYTYYTNDLS